MEKYDVGQPHKTPSSSSTARMSSVTVRLFSSGLTSGLMTFLLHLNSLFSLAVDKDMIVLDTCQNGLWSINFRCELYNWEKEDLDQILNSLSSISLVPLRDDKLSRRMILKPLFQSKFFARCWIPQVIPTRSGFTPFGNWLFPQRSNASYGWRSLTLSLRKSSSLHMESISPPTNFVVCGVAKLRSAVRTSFSPTCSVGEFGDMFLNGGESLGVLRVLYPLLSKLGMIQASEGVEAIDDMGWWTDPRLSSKRKAPHHHQVGTSWSPPPTGEFKFNVDSSAKGRPGLAGCGGVLQDSDGNVVGLFFYPIGLHDSNFAELMAILKALKFFAATPYTSSPLIIEFDSRVAL
ncbi:Uncharacterized protein TCM_031451 [Theobroma cacao]|uniref:RNase H type-1 domain-containing protein n=1 Tax=Theobroma cacao TaxID=3641 RepID=A0A061F7B7_THECC|nr:Uncharacterized protein TCM_031451 [Theobroma cacao]